METIATNAPKTSATPLDTVLTDAVKAIQSGNGAYAKCGLKIEGTNIPFTAKAAKRTAFEHGERFEIVGIAEHNNKKYGVTALVPAHIQAEDAARLNEVIKAGESVSIWTEKRIYTREDGKEQEYFYAELEV